MGAYHVWMFTLLMISVGRFVYLTKSQMNFANLYVLLLTYNTYMHLVNQDGVFTTQIISVFNIIVSFYCLIKLQKSRSKNSVIEGLKKIFLLFTFYGLFLILTSNVQITSIAGYVKVKSYWYLMEIYGAILPIFTIYYFTIKGYLRKEMLVIWLCVFVLLIPKAFIDSSSLIGNDVTNFFSANRTSNVGYSFVAILPALSLFNKNILFQFMILGYCLLFSLICMKRGPILICLLCLFVFILIKLKYVSYSRKLIIIICLILLMYFSIVFFVDFAGSNSYFLSRIEDTLAGESSGRDTLYSKFINYFLYEANPLQQLLGLGAYGTLNVGDNFAHNDWLELLIGQGLLGVSLYANYWLKFYKIIKKNIADQEVFLALTTFFIIYLLKTFFSMSYNDISIFSSLFFAYYLAQSDLRRINDIYFNK